MKGEARSGTWPEQVSREHNLVVTSVIVSAARSSARAPDRNVTSGDRSRDGRVLTRARWSYFFTMGYWIPSCSRYVLYFAGS